MDDVVARYRAASEANDIASLMELLADDVELVSPLSARLVFRGKDDLRVLLAAVYGSLSRWRWTDAVGDGSVRVIVGEGAVGPFELGDAMVLELAEDGRIRRIRPHLRPWLGLTFFALRLGPAIARDPEIVKRALRG